MKTTQEPTDQLSQSMEKHSICRRVMLMHALLNGYSLFESIQTKRNYTKCNITYKDAELIADKFEEVTGIDIAPEKFLHDKNQLADELLDDYQEYKSLMSYYDENTRSMAIAFYQHLFHYRKVPHEIVLTLQIALSAFLKYVSGNIDKKELKKQIINFDIPNQKTIEVDSMYVRHNFVCMEKDFNDICLKKANRILKQTGESSMNSYTINISL